MRWRPTISLVLLSCSLFAQKRRDPSLSQVIARAKQVIISTLDPALPDITLESFLAYETHHRPTEWQTTNCGEFPLYLAEIERGNGICVQAFTSLVDQRVLMITLGLTRHASHPTKLLSVSVIKEGIEHPIQLIDVPAAIQQSGFPRPSRRYPLRDVLPLGHAA